MDFKLFLPLASTLVVGGTFTVFYMGYLKNKEIRERKLDIKIPDLSGILNESNEKGKEEKPEDSSTEQAKSPPKSVSQTKSPSP